MIGFYLITGFLGAGKTTFLKQFLRTLQGRKLRMIVNEFGREGVDGALLSELGAVVDEISNGSIFCSCRLDKFEEALDVALANPPELLLAEASGLSDPTNLRKILEQDKYRAQFQYLGSVCLADAVNFEKAFSTVRACKKQLSVSSMVLLNKTDLVSPEQADKVESMILGQYPYLKIHRTAHGRFDPAWLEDLRPADIENTRFQPRDIALQSVTVKIAPDMGLESFKKFLGMFVEDTCRIKGFLQLGGTLYLADCVGAMVNVSPYNGPATSLNNLTVLSGGGVALKKAVEKAVEWYPDSILSVE